MTPPLLMFWFLIGTTFRFDSISLSHRLEAAHCGVEDADDEDGDASCVDVDSCHLGVQPLMTCCIIEKLQKQTTNCKKSYLFQRECRQIGDNSDVE